jgi:hypothetical protein
MCKYGAYQTIYCSLSREVNEPLPKVALSGLTPFSSKNHLCHFGSSPAVMNGHCSCTLDQDLTNWPLAQIPTTKLPNEKIPNEKTPTEKMPTEKRPAENIPAENKPADKTPELKSPADNHPDADSPGGTALGNGGAIRPISNNGINAPQIMTCAIL